MAGTLFVVATPIGNLEDVTLRALRVLREVDLIAAEDTRRTAKLLHHYSIHTKTTSLHQHNERQKLSALLSRLQEGKSIALVSDAGTPGVSDPGAQLIQEAIAQGIRVEPVPGPSAVLAALVTSGLPTNQFVFAGFPPSRSKDRTAWFQALAGESRTLVFFEAPHRIHETLKCIRETLGDRAVSVGRELTKVHEELVRGPISDVLDRLEAPKGEYSVVLSGSSNQLEAGLETPNDELLRVEFCRLTECGETSRRQAIAEVARRHGLPTRAVYAAVERAKPLP